MAAKYNVEIVSRETIKPCFPTPAHLQTFKLSLLDQLAHPIYTQLLLFFSKATTDETNNNDSNAQKAKLLKESLSKTLNVFYPFAGRITENHSIQCNDEGAEFVETKVRSQLSLILDKPDPDFLILLVPSCRVHSKEAPLLLVQANFFECGGLAIGVAISHKIADAATISSFLTSWAVRTSEPSSDILSSSQFVSPPLVPPHDSLSMLYQDSAPKSLTEKVSVARLVFQGKNITALREKVSSPTVQNPTRVEAVISVIWKCAMEASRSSSGSLVGQRRNSALFQYVNLRKLLSLKENTCGNFAWSYELKCEEETENETDLLNLVALIRKGIDEFKRGYRDRIAMDDMRAHNDEFFKLIQNDEVDTYLTTSWCRFPFYGVNFGWGKASWVCVPRIGVKNRMVLMDSRDGEGIEVCLALDEDHMTHFQTNKGLLEFASIYRNA